jgi:excisionase family DNA binding protein
MNSISSVGAGKDKPASKTAKRKQPEPMPKFVSVAQHAHKLGVSESFVRKLLDLGKIRYVRLEGRILIPADEDERLLQSAG